ncbi:MAG TPA: FkbM family methyltransferase [Pirellulaceae bacterium]|jgi:FkbM family methyltransferase
MTEQTATPASTIQTSAAKTCVCEINRGGSRRNFTLFDTPMGRRACEDVLGGKSYPALPLSGQIKTIVDIGANVGAATVYFAFQYPTARIWAFEPSPDSFALLTANTADLPQVQRFDFGLLDRDQQTLMYRGKDDAVENSIGRSRELSDDAFPIALRSAEAALTEAGIDTIDILKLDTEGCEVPILRSLSGRLARTGVIYVEFHAERDRLEIDRLLLPTHSLFRGQIMKPYRGELCYVARAVLPDTKMNISVY